MDNAILAHGSGVDDVLILACSGALVLSVRWLVARRRNPEDAEDRPDQAEGAAEAGP